MATFKIVLFLAAVALACDEFKIRCETTCEQDGDERAFVADGQCYCANKRDIKFKPTKLNNLKGSAPKPPSQPLIIFGEL